MICAKPSQVSIDPIGAIVATLGKAEHEMCAALIVRWHHRHSPDEWTPMSRADVATLLDGNDELVASWGANPSWRPEPGAFAHAGFVDGWSVGADAKGTLTAKFFEGIGRRFRTQPFRAGDAVHVLANGETWVVAVYDASRDVAWIAGWPCTMVPDASTALKLKRAATDAQHASMVESVSQMRGEHGGGEPRRSALESVQARGGVP
jgi:hypothetical protein